MGKEFVRDIMIKYW